MYQDFIRLTCICLGDNVDTAVLLNLFLLFDDSIGLTNPGLGSIHEDTTSIFAKLDRKVVYLAKFVVRNLVCHLELAALCYNESPLTRLGVVIDRCQEISTSTKPPNAEPAYLSHSN